MPMCNEHGVYEGDGLEVGCSELPMVEQEVVALLEDLLTATIAWMMGNTWPCRRATPHLVSCAVAVSGVAGGGGGREVSGSSDSSVWVWDESLWSCVVAWMVCLWVSFLGSYDELAMRADCTKQLISMWSPVEAPQQPPTTPAVASPTRRAAPRPVAGRRGRRR